MHENFRALEGVKRDRIINTAMREFSAKGFKNASTNEIVKKAGISKGALFHYFTSKLDLFGFLYRYSMGFFLEIIAPYLNDMPTDVFERWSAFAALKLRVVVQYPDMVDFMQNAFRDDARDIQEVLKNVSRQFFDDFLKKIYDGIDVSKFKPDVDIPKALQIIWWVLEGFALSKQTESLDASQMKSDAFVRTTILEVETYLGILKKTFYKVECLR